jgi:two-component system, cell cycle response regulator
MRRKILVVDDSQMVRSSIKKIFSGMDCEVAEARDGVEGFTVATRFLPELILLDLTMPIMDGTTLLTRIRSDPHLRATPVIILTAKGGRADVVTLAKLGVKGYVTKPFRAEALLEKVVLMLDLQPIARIPPKERKADDPVKILLVEDKLPIVEQIREALAPKNWLLHGCCDYREALEVAHLFAPDLIVISLSLPEGSAFNLFRSFRANPATRATPIFALFVQGNAASKNRVQEIGFTDFITKPINAADLHDRFVHALHFDSFKSLFRVERDTLVVRLPDVCSAFVLQNIAGILKTKLSEATDAGSSRLVLDLETLRGLSMGVVKFAVEAERSCRDLGIRLALVGRPKLALECGALVETRNWVFHSSVECAQAALLGTALSGSLVEH